MYKLIIRVVHSNNLAVGKSEMFATGYDRLALERMLETSTPELEKFIADLREYYGNRAIYVPMVMLVEPFDIGWVPMGWEKGAPLVQSRPFDVIYIASQYGMERCAPEHEHKLANWLAWWSNTSPDY